jgi:hypothetical protein
MNERDEKCAQEFFPGKHTKETTWKNSGIDRKTLNCILKTIRSEGGNWIYLVQMRDECSAFTYR